MENNNVEVSKVKNLAMTNYEIIEFAPPLSTMRSHIEHLLNV
jgi:hypothetical protein